MPSADTIAAQLRAAGCVFAEDEAALLIEAATGDDDRLESLALQRIGGRPLEHVVGWAEFRGLRIEVDEGVFVPRARTEALVEHALELARGREQHVVVDLCCGSGAIGAALNEELVGRVDVYAVDIDGAAVACARRNVEPRGGHVMVGDLDEPLPRELRGQVTTLAANVPYVATADIPTLPREARDHEPLGTLDGGDDGLDVARHVLAVAPRWLAPGGHVFVEVTPQQAPTLVAAAAEHGLRAQVHVDDELDATIVAATVLASGSRAPTGGRPPEP